MPRYRVSPWVLRCDGADVSGDSSGEKDDSCRPQQREKTFLKHNEGVFPRNAAAAAQRGDIRTHNAATVAKHAAAAEQAAARASKYVRRRTREAALAAEPQQNVISYGKRPPAGGGVFSGRNQRDFNIRKMNDTQRAAASAGLEETSFIEEVGDVISGDFSDEDEMNVEVSTGRMGSLRQQQAKEKWWSGDNTARGKVAGDVSQRQRQQQQIVRAAAQSRQQTTEKKKNDVMKQLQERSRYSQRLGSQIAAEEEREKEKPQADLRSFFFTKEASLHSNRRATAPEILQSKAVISSTSTGNFRSTMSQEVSSREKCGKRTAGPPQQRPGSCARRGRAGFVPFDQLSRAADGLLAEKQHTSQRFLPPNAAETLGDINNEEAENEEEENDDLFLASLGRSAGRLRQHGVYL